MGRIIVLVQRLFALQPGGDVLVERDFADLDTAIRDSAWIWIDVSQPEAAEVGRLVRLLGLSARTHEDILDDTEYPKLDAFDDYLFLVFHSLGTATDRLHTEEIDMVIGERFLATFHRSVIPAVEWMQDQLEELPAEYTETPSRMAALLAEASSRRYLPLLDALDLRIEDLEEPAALADPVVLGDIQSLRRDAVVLRRTTAPQRDVFARLATSRFDLVDPVAQGRFAAVYDDQRRIVESLESARLLLASVLDTYRSAVAENMNQVMKVLTVFSAILLPLSLMAGIYGMNFVNIPELDWQVGYFVLLGIMATTAVGLWLYFARRGFIGSPRLDKLPRTVGRGLGSLVHLTTSPLRIVGYIIQEAVEDDPDGEV